MVDSELRRDTARAVLVSERATEAVASLKEGVTTGERTGETVRGLSFEFRVAVGVGTAT